MHNQKRIKKLTNVANTMLHIPLLPFSDLFLLQYCFLSFLLRFPPTAAFDNYINCSTSAGSYAAANSTYLANLNLLFSSLASSASNASVSSPGFSKATAGSSPSQTYGLVLCRGDINATTCSSCLNNASTYILQLCPLKKDAIIWFDDCLLRYSDVDFRSSFDDGPQDIVWNPDNVTGDRDLFNSIVGELMNATADWATHNTTTRFATGWASTNFSTEFSMLYGMVQCTPDMPAATCRACLQDQIGEMPLRLDGRMGGRMLGGRCNVRYELDQFYNGNPPVKLVLPASQVSTSPVAPAPAIIPAAQRGRKGTTKTVIIVVISVAAAALLLLSAISLCLRIRRKPRKPAIEGDDQEIISMTSLLFDFAMLRAATRNFSEENKLGEGGFGSVYKGILKGGQEIAVKRLSMSSGQGLVELKNEVMLMAKLHHRNMVRLIGCCLEEQEKLLVYEYLPNKSLDKFLFDPVKRKQLDWERRYKIIEGISRGFLYLHEDSRLKIVHRDLKASNILLDAYMTPKISDFGLAKLFDVDASEGNTNRIAGTYGYMAPEYAIHGHFSTKSDVFSYGVLVLEIVTGRRNARPQDSIELEGVLSYVWKHWTRGIAHQVLDPSLEGQCRAQDVVRCIHIGLLCVQENPSNRPSMASVVLMLSSLSITLPAPSTPAFVIQHSSTAGNSDEDETDAFGRQRRITTSVNDVTISEFEPR